MRKKMRKNNMCCLLFQKASHYKKEIRNSNKNSFFAVLMTKIKIDFLSFFSLEDF